MDDFALRRGTRYGTVLVDLEQRRLVDVLPDRRANTFARWLEEHPGVEVVSRDRGGEYAEAARRAAPHAVQVADRFHLLKNLRDVVSRVFRQHDEILELVPCPMNHLQRLTNLRLDREASKERTKEQERLAKPVPDRLPGISASHAAGILVKRPENRSEGEIRTLQSLKTVHSITERCCTLFEEFAGMLRDKDQRNAEQVHRQLEAWTERAKASGIAEMNAFAVKLLQDSEAVLAAMTLPYSQGQTEGRINKLKFVKRSMYGRGKFDLLRQRVLYEAS